MLASKAISQPLQDSESTHWEPAAQRRKERERQVLGSQEASDWKGKTYRETEKTRATQRREETVCSLSPPCADGSQEKETKSTETKRARGPQRASGRDRAGG